MQHNAIYGTEKKDFNKTQDLPRSGPLPPPTAATGCSTVLGTPIDTTPDAIPSLPSPTDTVPEANSGQPTSPDITSDDVIMDHLQYLSYHS